jgi:predicted ribosome-associated RNA-binding protein Tma20
MFKKRIKISNSHALSNKDKKTMKELMGKMDYDKEYTEFFFNDKNYEGEGVEDDDARLTMDKLQG